MNRPFCLFPVFFGLSIILHGAAFLFSPGFRSFPVLPKTEQIFWLSLINIDVFEPQDSPEPRAVEPSPSPALQVPDKEYAAVEEHTVIEQMPSGQDSSVREEAGEYRETESMDISEDAVDTGAAAGEPANGDTGGIIGDTTAVTDERAPSERPALIAAYTRRNFEFIRRRIREKLVYPPRARRTGVQGRAEVIFTIRPDGSVSDVWIRISSGQDILDKAIVDAVYAAAPFPPPPVQAKIAAPVSFRLR